MMEAKIVEHSVNPAGVELVTFQLRYPRFIHAEFLTHRLFSRNASSSRAIPVAKMIEQVRNDPAMPIHWGKNQPGMQAHEQLEGHDLADAQALWFMAARAVSVIAEQMNAVGLHKQVANRILEPFQYISVIVTATDWDNFYELRDHPDAQPEIQALARAMKAAHRACAPVPRVPCGYGRTLAQSWHLPYVTQEEREEYANEPDLLVQLSTARCARVSYLTHDGQKPSIEKDIELHDRLVGSRPIHASPTEHVAHCADENALQDRFKNFTGWMQYRTYVERLIQSRETEAKFLHANP